MSPSKSLTFPEAAARVLHDAGVPLHVNEITRRALEGGLVRSDGKTPSASMGAILAVSVKGDGDEGRFVCVKPGTFGLREWVEEGRISADSTAQGNRVRVPHHPTNEAAAAALVAWEGLTRDSITGMRGHIMSLTGTPQANLDWSDPDQWIPERLTGDVRATARRTWDKSDGKVSPRHTTGHWYLLTGYELLADDTNGGLAITEAGRDFLQNPQGTTAQRIDESEGLLHLLALISEIGPAAPRDLSDPWMEYLQAESRIRATSSARSYLSARLRNLLARGYVAKAGNQYAVTDSGAGYLRVTGTQVEPGEQSLHDLIRDQAREARETLRELLAEVDPFAFEYVIKDLLEAMGYTGVEVTSRGNDKGVDVVGEIELGITNVKEVVQVKRHKPSIQRPVLDALRGSLHRFQAVRGTIITTGGFSRGTREAAFEPGAAPITLIDGDKLIELLVEHGIGVRKRKVELLEVDPSAFGSQNEDAE